ncbi:MAG TPA: AgmX/PglI C-terminal domain-containing protein, partial [Myxococcaceae bacterium]
LAAGLLWMMRTPQPEQMRVTEAHGPEVSVTAVAAPSAGRAPQPVLSVERSPLQRSPQPLVADWRAAEPVPGPVVPGRSVASQAAPAAVVAVASEPKPAPVAPAAVAAPAPKLEPVTQETVASMPRLGEVTGAMARASQRLGPVGPIGPSPSEGVRNEKPELTASVKAEAVKPKPEQRRLIEDPYLAEAEAETPFLQQPAPTAPAPVAKAMPAPAPAPNKPNEYEDLDEAFARELGFTPGSKRKTPEPTGVKSVWIPPDPASQLPESLTPAQIQQVVVANQPAIVSCIQRFKDSVPGVSGGKFVVRWFVHPDGSTYGQRVETKELRGTALGTCIERLVPTWKFPQHRVKQQEPIRFPFIF